MNMQPPKTATDRRIQLAERGGGHHSGGMDDGLRHRQGIKCCAKRDAVT